MGEFARMEEDWGFQAIVSGCTDDLSAAAMSSSFDDLLFDYPNIFEAKSGDYNNNEFDQLYKPFHQVFDDSFSSQSPIGSGADTPLSSSFNDKALKLKSQELKMKKGPKTTYKKRKNQHKKMVLQAESLSSDPWAWRKYGQKPIKGSPYPRSYYKCSSSKECVARKQVEESCSDPGMFIITYSGEHNHTQPTRRRSLAGTTRHRFTPHASSSSSSVATVVPKDCDSSPTTPLSNSVNIEESTMFQQSVVKNAKNINLVNEEKSCSEVSKDDSECVISDDMLMNDDFFVGLEDLDRLISESGFYSFPYQSL